MLAPSRRRAPSLPQESAAESAAWPFPRQEGPEVPASVIRPRRRGATALEFAVVAPVFFALILGLVEFGRACMVMELLNEAARRGCRQGIIEGTTSDKIKKAATDFLTSSGINGESAGVSVNDAPVDTVEAQNMPAYTEITVVVSVPASSVTWLPGGGFLSGNLSGQFTMRRE